MELRLPLEMSPGREAACRAVFGTWRFFSERCTEKLPLRVDFIQPLAAPVQSAVVDCHYRLQNSSAITAALISTAATVSVRISRKSAYVIPPLPCVPDGFPGVAQTLNLPAMWETWVQYLGQEDPLEKGMATHPSILAWRIP